MMLLECSTPIHELLEVQIERTTMALRDDTTIGSELTVIHVADACASCLIHTNSGVECECNILRQLDFEVTGTVDSITLTVICVESNCLEGIRIS